MAGSNYPNKSEFLQVVARIRLKKAQLTFEDIGKVFGPEFYVMIIYMLMDAQDASRAIAGAISRLKTEASTMAPDEEPTAQATAEATESGRVVGDGYGVEGT